MSQDKETGYYAAFLFLVWPLLALASAFKNYRECWAKNILWAFVAFYGFTFAIGAESQGNDIVRYIAEVKYLHSIDLSATDAVRYFLKSGELDILRTLIAVTLSRITDMQAILTLIYGIIFGFFFSRNMWFVLSRLEGKIKLVTILLFVSLFLVIPIWNMNGFRFWTAAHVFIYGILPYLFEGKKTGTLISASAILVHFSFVVPVGVLLAYLFIGNRLVLYFAFFIATFFISQINLSAFNQLVENYAPETVQERTEGYRKEIYVERFREGGDEENKNWYAVWNAKALNWSVMGFLVILFIKGRSFFSENEGWLRLYSFTLLFYGVSNLFASLPSGGRFVSLAQIMALTLIILYIQNREQEVVMERFVWAATPALLLFVVVAIRMGLYSTSATSLLGNPIVALFLTGDFLSLNDFMRMIL